MTSYHYWFAAFVEFIGGVWILIHRHRLVLPRGLPLILSFGLIALGVHRAIEGNRIVGRRRDLGRLPAFSIEPKELLKKEGRYLGRGFLWETRHTQALYGLGKGNIGPFLAKDDRLGGYSILHGVGAQEERDVVIPHPELKGHTLIVGTTQVGKTRLFEIEITQAIHEKDMVLIIDPKGDEALLNRVVEEARSAGRGEDFVFFALPYPAASATYNPLQNFMSESDVPDRIAPLIGGDARNKPFRDFAWEVVATVTCALLACGIRPTLSQIHKYSLVKMSELVKMLLTKILTEKGKQNEIQAGEEQSLEEEVDHLIDVYRENGIESEAADNLIALYLHPKDHFSKMITSLKPIMSKLTLGEKGRLLSTLPADIDWERAVSKGKIVYMFLGSLLGEETANAVAQMALQDFTAFIGARYHYLTDRRPVSVFVDEFYNVVSQEFINVINKGGGAEVRVTVALQSIADLEAKLGSEAKARQVLGNTNSWVFLRATDLETAKVFTDKVNRKTVVKVITEGSSMSPEVKSPGPLFKSGYNRTIIERETDLIQPQWLTALPKGQGFVYCQGRVYKVRFPLLPETKTDYLKERGIK